MKKNSILILLMMCCFFAICCAPCDDGTIREDDTSAGLESEQTSGRITQQDSVAIILD